MYNTIYKMVNKSRETNEKNCVETIVDNDGILWLNEKHITERLDHENLQVTPLKYLSDHKKYRYKLVDEQKNNQQNVYRWKTSNQSNHGF